MTVAKMIELLRRFPQDAEVEACSGTHIDPSGTEYKAVVLVHMPGQLLEGCTPWWPIDTPDNELPWLNKTFTFWHRTETGDWHLRGKWSACDKQAVEATMAANEKIKQYPDQYRLKEE